MRRILTTMLLGATLGSTAVAFGSASASSTSTPSCAAITKAVVLADGYSAATGPKITKYNYTNTAKNAANALGTTIDFGAKALVVGCVSPSDIAKLSKAAGKSTMTATQYMAYMVKQSAGAMKATKVGGVTDYLDFGNGKEDGLGSLSTAVSLRLDAWVVGNFIVLGFSQPAMAAPSSALLHFIASTKSLL